MVDLEARPGEAAVLLDRDGTLIVDVGYPRLLEQVCLLPGVGEGLRALKDLGFRLVLVSNQSGIGRGIISFLAADAVHEKLVELFAEVGVTLDAAYYCPHRPEDDCT